MKIAICVPAYGDPKLGFAYSLARMVVHTAKTLPNADLEVFFRSDLITNARTDLVADALKWGATHVLFADSDHRFPPETLVRLTSLNLDFVGANHVKRRRPTYPVGVIGTDSAPAALWTTEDKARQGLVEQALHIGLGLALIRIDIFKALQQPLFAMEFGEDGRIETSEDVYFSRKVRAAGHAIHVDHWLSWHVSHLGTQAVTHADALTDNSNLKVHAITDKGLSAAASG